ncbi:MAG: septum formation initiator family protein [Eubacteriaceae bacterium]|nr:septum formation initiator family protein [Eubacteriaceae bacterium]
MSRKKRRRINLPRMILTCFIVVSMVMVGLSVNNIVKLRAEQKELIELNEKLAAEKAALKEELKNVNDYEYIEEQARIQLRLVKPGEILYILEEDEGKEEN